MEKLFSPVILCAACGGATLWSLPTIPLSRQTEPSSTLHPSGAASRSESSTRFQSLVPKSWSAFQRTRDVRREPAGRCQEIRVRVASENRAETRVQKLPSNDFVNLEKMKRFSKVMPGLSATTG